MSLGSGRCFSHPQRPGLGICVECRHVICVECTTQFEGINRCSSCLTKRLEGIRSIAGRNEWSFGSVTWAVLSLTMLFGLFAALFAIVAH